MTAAYIPERIHSIRAQSEPYVSWFHTELYVLSIDVSPLDGISRMSKLSIYITLLRVSTQQLCILRVFV